MANITKWEQVEVSKLKPYENNAKIHGEEQVEQIANSIQEFGFVSPCIVDKDYNLIAGHGRIEAAKKLGMSEVPCVFVEGLTEAQRKAYVLADNRLTELGEWDWDKVREELKELEDLKFNVSLTGFDMDILDISDEIFVEGKDGELIENPYTEKVAIPQYEPRDVDVNLEDCLDLGKYYLLCEEIESDKNLSLSEKEFLKFAAARHIVFDYSKIADYYAKANKDVQKHFEKSALVIIDIGDALKYGYLKLENKLMNIINKQLEEAKDYEDED